MTAVSTAPSSGVGRVKLAERVERFYRGEWLGLLEDAHRSPQARGEAAAEGGASAATAGEERRRGGLEASAAAGGDAGPAAGRARERLLAAKRARDATRGVLGVVDGPTAAVDVPKLRALFSIIT